MLCYTNSLTSVSLKNGWQFLKSPYNALQTLEHLVRHVFIRIVSLVIALADINHVYKTSGQKSLGNFFFTDVMHWVLFWIKFLLDFYQLVAKWWLKNFF